MALLTEPIAPSSGGLEGCVVSSNQHHMPKSLRSCFDLCAGGSSEYGNRVLQYWCLSIKAVGDGVLSSSKMGGLVGGLIGWCLVRKGDIFSSIIAVVGFGMRSNRRHGSDEKLRSFMIRIC